MTLHDEVGLPAGSSVLPDIHGRSVRGTPACRTTTHDPFT